MLLDALVLGHMRSRSGSTLLVIVAIALGVGAFLAIALANATAVTAFATSTNLVDTRVTLQIVGGDEGFDERVFARVAGMPGVREARPVVEDSLALRRSAAGSAAPELLRVEGVDTFEALPRDAETRVALPGAFAPWPAGPAPSLFVSGSGIVISARVATRYRLKPGSVLVGLAGVRAVRFRVASVLPNTVVGVDSSTAFVDVATAQRAFEKFGRLDRIDCVTDGAQRESVRARLADVLPPGLSVLTAGESADDVRRMLAAFGADAGAASLIALLVGSALAYNAVALSVASRRADIGTLRALGATRRAIFAAFLAEGALYGAVGSTFGLLLGTATAGWAARIALGGRDVGANGGHVAWLPEVIAFAFAAGVACTTLATLGPALSGARTSPAAAMGARGFERSRSSARAWFAIAGLLCVALGVAALRAGSLSLGHAALALFVCAGLASVPLAVAAFAALARAASVASPPPVRLAALHAGAFPTRTSVAVASLALALALLASVDIATHSYRAAADDWARRTLAGDFSVRVAHATGVAARGRFSQRMLARLRRLDGVAAAIATREVEVPFRQSRPTLIATDGRAPRDRDRDRRGESDAALRPGEVVIGDVLANRYGLRPHDRIALDTPSRRAFFSIARTARDFGRANGSIELAAPTFARLYGDPSFDRLTFYARPKSDVVALRTRVVRALAPLALDVATMRELRTHALATFDGAFALAGALALLALLVAVGGVALTLTALVLERRAEFGALRHVGLGRGDVGLMIVCEAAFIGVIGAGVGLTLGGVLGSVAIGVVDRSAFGSIVPVVVPAADFAFAAAAVVVAAMLAGTYPARVAGRIRADAREHDG